MSGRVLPDFQGDESYQIKEDLQMGYRKLHELIKLRTTTLDLVKSLGH